MDPRPGAPRAAQQIAKANVEQAKATVATAQINLAYATIKAPVNGYIGRLLKKQGSLVAPADPEALTQLSDVHNVHVYFSLSEQEYLRDAGKINGGGGKSGQPWQNNLSLILADGTTYDKPGHYLAADRQVDPKTGTIRISAAFPNPGNRLRPGQYGRARFVLETRKDAMLVPQRAVQELQNLYNVAVVGSDNKVAFKTVTVGPRVGSLWVIASGITPSDRVVIEGLQRLRPGMTVSPKAAPPGIAGSGTPEPAAAGEGK